MEQNMIFEIVRNLLLGVKNGGVLIDEFNGGQIKLNSCSYLLNQTIRQYQIPENHYFISKKAFELWSKISTDSILKYTYRDKIIKNIPGIVYIDKYKGSEKLAYEKGCLLDKGDSFIYNDVFTDEHVVTVSNIIEELLMLTKIDDISIKSVLDKIYICKMLKEEDRCIKNKNRRSLDYREVITEDYFDVGIKLQNFDLKNTLETLIEEYKTDIERLSKKDSNVI